MIPSHIWDNNSSEKGEPQVFKLLEQINLSEVCYCMHTLNLHGGRKQRWHELDFLVISRNAIFGLEVKAGEVRCIDGVWHVYRKDGKIAYSKHKSPLVQASDSLDHFRTNWLKEKYGKRFDKVPFVKIAILCSNHRPDLTLNPMGPELLDQLTAYSEDLEASRFKSFLNRAIEYEVANTPQGNSAPLKNDDIEELKVAIRPSLDKTYPSRAAFESVQSRQDELTKNQYEHVDRMCNAFRYIMDGGAGTGKTFLMIYDIQRRVPEETIGVLVPYEPLAEYIRERVGAGVTCLTPSSAEQLNIAFDVLYVDEAQDFVNHDGFMLIDGLVKKGLTGGVWRIFGDFENQLAPASEIEADVWNTIVESTGNNMVLPLRRNVRNTPEIVEWLEATCSARVGETEALGAGPEVEVISEADFWDLLTGKKFHPLYGEVRRDEVVVLYPDELGVDRVDRLSSQFRNKCRVSSIEQFRGLESPVIFIKGLDSIDDLERLQDQSYKAVSRARNLCFIEGEGPMLSRLNKLMRYCRDK